MTTASEEIRKSQDETSDVVREELAWQATWGRLLYWTIIVSTGAAVTFLLGLLYSGNLP